MKKFLLSLLVISAIYSCKTWVSEDITEENITLLSPSDNHSDSLQNQQFWWEEIEGALEYQIQIVSPKFDSVITSSIDSNISSNTVNFTLTPGKYQWRVRGVNNDYESEWSTRSVTIKSTASLAGQTIIISTPITGMNSNTFKHDINWNSLSAADSYLVDILDSLGNSVNVFNTTNTLYQYTFPDEGLFTVKVQALNDVSASFASETKVLIDTTQPSNVDLIFPLLDTIPSFPTSFTWDFDIDHASAITQRLIISKDSLFTDLLLDTLINSQKSLSIDTLIHSGNTYWKVKRTDAAGNDNEGANFNSFWLK